MNTPLFRSTAMERLSSPEQLDQLLSVTAPKGWLALAALCGFLCMAIAWGVSGTVTTRVSGQGVIMATGGVLNVVSVGAGRVTALKVRPGDAVSKGQVVATLTNPALSQKVADAQAELDAARKELLEMTRLHNTGIQLQSDVLQRERGTIESRIVDLTRQVQSWREQAAADDALQQKGLITRQQLAAGKQKVSEGADEIERLRTQLKRLSADNFSSKTQSMQDILGRQNRVDSLERQLQDLDLELASVAEVTSEFEGRVMELKTEPGNLVTAGGTVLTLEGGVQQLEAVFFVPATVGKQIQQGMAVEISPSTERREEFGFLKAGVSYVSTFPVTPDAIMRRFGNELMLQSLAGSGPLTEVRAELQRDSKAPGGFRRSFSRAPAIALTSGTICTADVEISGQHPVELMIPAFRRAL